MTADQQLTISKKPKIASGDVESVKLKVEFDALWDNYSARSAIFYTANDSTVYEKLLTNDECVVPHEVLEEAGILYIGIRGLKADGTAIKTSTIIKYKIAEGAKMAGETTKEPSPDMYQQFLEAVDSKLDPFRADFEHTLDVKLEEQSQAVNDAMNSAVSHVETKINNEVYAIMAGDVLWTNPDTTQSFAAQTIELDLTEFKRFVIVFKCYCDEDRHFQLEFNEKNIIWDAGYPLGYSSNTRRQTTIKDTGVEFGSPEAPGTNKHLIPSKIIGYKY